MPLSLNMIEDRLNKRYYENMEKLEAELKRMVQNAKDYNNSRSQVFEDAERIRKALSNFMPKHNPAYLRNDYRAYPAPIPPELMTQARQQSVATESSAGPDKVKLVFSNPAVKRRQSQATPSTGTPAAVDQAVKDEQLAFLQELSEQDDAINFEEKVPKKDYPDYYKVIKRPTSIAEVRAMVEDDVVQDWDTLAKEVRLIWDNAKEYNADDSDIYLMAEKLETWSEARLQSLGAKPRQNLKISLTQPKPKALRLTMGGGTPTPAPNLVGGTVDSESLRRQKLEMAEAINRAQRASSRPTQVNGHTPGPASTAPSIRRSISLLTDAADSSMTDVKVNGAAGTPQPGIQQLPTPVQEVEPILTNGVTSRPSSQKGATAGAFNYMNQSPIPMERRYRDPGRGTPSSCSFPFALTNTFTGWDHALLHSVTFTTNPSLPNDPKWRLTRPSSPLLTQTSGFISLPSNYRDIRIIPTLSTLEIARRKRHRVLFIHNQQVYREPNSLHVPGAFEVRLQPGENLLAVEVLADLREGERNEWAGSQGQFDFERCGLIVQLN
jgi:hypothetical protein